MPPQKPRRVTLKELICGEKPCLGYCCEWVFFKRFRKTARIADKLGVSTRAVRYHKMAADQNDTKCEGKENCMKERLLAK